MARIIFEGVTKHYDDGFTALRNLDLEIADGEFLVLVGPSGCGKSTALRAVAGLEEITSGTITIDDVVVNDLAPRDRDVAMVFQNYALYPHLSVRDNIGFGLRVRGYPKAQMAEKIEQTAALLELTPFLDRKPAMLSGGQRQRVAMGRAMARTPKAFLMDEPLSNLDAKLRSQMRAEITAIQSISKITTLYVTHDQVEAMTMGQRVAVMKDGQLQQLGAPRDIYRNPHNMFVAGFIGSPSMNMLHCELTADGDKLNAMFGSYGIELTQNLRAKLSSHKLRSVVLGIRPEHLAANQPGANAGDHSATISLRGCVIHLEELGATNLAHIQLGETPGGFSDRGGPADDTNAPIRTGVKNADILAVLDGEFQIKQNQLLPLAAADSSVYLFDPETGNVI